jgi:hypothetical protein
MSHALKINMCLNDDDDTEVTITLYQYDYEPGRPPNFRGHPDNWTEGYGSVAYIQSYHIDNAPPGKVELTESELENLEELIIAHHEED